MINQIVRGTFRLLTRLLEFVIDEAWLKPAGIRGKLWTILWWVRTVCFVMLAVSACLWGGWLVGPLLLAAHIWLHHLNKQPVKLGRPLPYRRRR